MGGRGGSDKLSDEVGEETGVLAVLSLLFSSVVDVHKQPVPGFNLKGIFSSP